MDYVEKLLIDWRPWIMQQGRTLGGDRDDLFSEVAVRVCRRANEDQVCAAYLKEVTRFALIDMTRAHKYAQLPSEECLPPSKLGGMPSELLAAKEQANEILRMVTPAEREVLLLYSNGDSVGEIAEQLGKHSNAVHSTLQRARAKIRHRMTWHSIN